jgi:YQGE family putative transporter
MCREAKILLLINALFTFAMGLSGVFINVFFWRGTGSFNVIILYNLMHYISMPFAFIAAGMLAKKKNGVWSLRIGLLMHALFFALILIAGNKGGFYIYALGILYGTAGGFFWLAYNTLTFDFTCMDNRDTFNGFNGTCSSVAAAIAPIISGFIISRFAGFQGYNIVFIITLSMFVILVLISLIIKCKSYGSKVNFKMCISNNCHDWGIYRRTIFFWGIRDTTIGFVISILIIQTTGSELSLGKLTLVGALVSAASYALVQKIIKPPKRRFAVYFGAVGAFAALIGIIYEISYITLLMFTIIDAFFIPFFLIQYSSTACNIIDRAHDEDMRVEYMINRNIVINTGRALSALLILLMVLFFKHSSIIKFYLFVIGFSPIVSGYFLRKLKSVLEGTKHI